MSYYLILAADFPPPQDGNFSYITSDPSLAALRQKKTYDPAERKTDQLDGLVLVKIEDHALLDVSAAGGAQVPAAIYHA